ncbi:DNA-directed RNA polymerase II subunit RPB1-like protein [Lates japonicus]|uniref:DNA-directed RNA polymerase II subunit RPB1-like protein n=1 Tax=Lates japonicus TaxID=270547 RepID=A0AAD3RK45_LATJO|nr:DNA-directed RNA polymerase II subunit RPB1-like protein [Lates japonicus]
MLQEDVVKDVLTNRPPQSNLERVSRKMKEDREILRAISPPGQWCVCGHSRHTFVLESPPPPHRPAETPLCSFNIHLRPRLLQTHDGGVPPASQRLTGCWGEIETKFNQSIELINISKRFKTPPLTVFQGQAARDAERAKDILLH